MTGDATLAGWHKDPSGRHELRFWDGDRWTEHVVDEGFPGLDHPTRSGRPPAGVTPTPAPALPTAAELREADPDAADVAVAEQLARERAEIEREAAAARDDAEQAVREAAERERAERSARAEAELAAEAAAAREAAERAAREAAESAAREASEREAAARAARQRSEQVAEQAAERETAEQTARELALLEASDREQQERAAREAAETAAREASEREATERAAREAAETAAREASEREATERAAREAAEQAVARETAEQAVRDRAAREASEREATERAAREAAETAAREASEREATERAAREAAETAAREASEREATERAAREAAERAVARDAEEQARRERATEAAAAREAAERAAREAAETAAREASEREATERAAREAAETAAREASEREATERAAREAAETAAREASEREAAERAAREAAEALAAQARTETSRHVGRPTSHSEPGATPSWRRRNRGPGEMAPAPRATEPVAGHVHVDAVARTDAGDDPEVIKSVDPMRLLAEPPSVASPAGSSAGSTTSAIADPHRSGTTATPSGPPADSDRPRVAGVSPTPVKRYRPGAPPASPHLGARALPTGSVTTSAPSTPWYRRLAPWSAIVAVAAAIAVIALLVGTSGSSGSGDDAGAGRPPAAAPRGTQVIDGDHFGIAAPDAWIVGTDAGGTFGQLRQTQWGEPRLATSSDGTQALVVAPLHNVAHDPLADPQLFWADQIDGEGSGRTVSAPASVGVHGLKANRVLVNDRSGSVIATAIETDHGVYLVAFRALSDADAKDLFGRLIQTFDAR